MSNFGKGITIASGFDLSAKTPLDSRAVVNNFDELEEHVRNNRVYEGMIVYVISEQKTVQYINSSWIPFGTDAYEGTNIVIDNLNSLLANASLSANQGRILREMIETLQGNYYTKEEIDEIREILENQDIEISQIVGDLEQFFPKKISYFENDMNYLTEDNLEETLKYITIPAKTSDLINDAGYITQENLEENVVSKIPIKTSQLENDAGYITQENIEENVVSKIPVKTSQLENDAGYVTQENIEKNVIGLIPTQVSQLENDKNYITKEELGDISGLVGGASVHIGKEPPTQNNVLWVDSSVTYSLEPDSFEGRLRLNYISMVNKNYFKLLALQSRLVQIEENIINISSEHSTEAVQYKTEVAQINSQIMILENRIQTTLTSLNDIETDFIPLKDVSKNIRREVKSLFYSVLNLNNSVMVTLDNEKGITIDDNEDEKPDDDTSVKNALLTEDGNNILTEDGLIIIADILSMPDDALLTENGVSILTEDGRIILIDGFTSDEVVKDAILSELGQAILTEDGRILLKG